MKPFHRLVFALLFVLTGTCGATLAAQDQLPVEILQTDGEYAGVSMAEWDARSIQQLLTWPVGMEPGFDPTGALCGLGQSGPVFNLPENFHDSRDNPPTMRCFIPEGLAIHVVINQMVCSTIDASEFYAANEEDMRACAKEAQDWVRDVRVTINGVEVENPMQYRRQTEMFTIQAWAGNGNGLNPGVGLAVVDNITFLILPPEPGQYTIVVEFTDPAHGAQTYIIDVVPPTTLFDQMATPAP